MTTTDGERQTLDVARAQRADLWRHLVALEQAISTPLPGRVQEWASTVHEALVDLSATFERHCGIVEAPDGVFDQVLAAAPRLESKVELLRREHVEIADAITAELRSIRDLASSAQVDDAVAARQRITDLLTALSRHRQGGADMVYEAYAVDIGVGD